MARKKNGNSKALSVTLTVSNFETLEDYRWSQRKSFSDMLDEAVNFYIEAKGIKRVEAPAEAEAPVEAEKPAK